MKTLPLTIALVSAATAFSAEVWNNNAAASTDVKTATNWKSGAAPAFNVPASPVDVSIPGSIDFLQTINWNAARSGNFWYVGDLTDGARRRIALNDGNNRLFSFADVSGFDGYFRAWGARNALNYHGEDGTRATLHQAAIIGRLGLRAVDGGSRLTAEHLFGIGKFDVNRDMSGAAVAAGAVEIVSMEGGPRAAATLFNGSLVLHGAPYDAPGVAGDPFLHLDAAEEDSLVKETSGDRVLVSRWNDVRWNGLYAAADADESRPTFVDGCVDFGSFTGKYGSFDESNTHETTAKANAASPAGWLRLSSVRSDIREAFIVFRDNAPYNHNAPYFGAPDGAKDVFERTCKWIVTVAYLHPNVFRSGGGIAEISAGDVRVDGARIEPFGETGIGNIFELRRFDDRLHVVSAGLDGTAAVDRIAANSHGSGGLRIAEVILYTNALTSAERRQVNAYLRAKWQTAEEAADRDLASLDVRGGTPAIDIASGCARIGRVDVVSKTPTFTKKGSGELTVERGLSGAAVTVEGGALSFANGGADETPDASAPADGPDMWFNADNTDSYEQVFGTGDYAGTVWAKVWHDSRDGTNSWGFAVQANTAFAYGNGNNTPYGYPDWPTLAAGPFGRTALDFGDLHSAEDFKSVSTTRADEPDDRPNAASFAVNKNPVGGALKATQQMGTQRMFFAAVRRKAFTSYIFGGEYGTFLASNGVLDGSQAPGTMHGGVWTLNGSHFDPSHEGFPINEWIVVGVETPVGMSMHKIAQRGNTGAVGGIEIGEILIYDRILTAAERRQTEAYLMRRWVDEDYVPDDGAEMDLASVAFASGVAPVLSFDGPATVGSVTAEGTLVKKGAGDVEITSALGSVVTGVDVQGGSLSVALAPGAGESSASLGSLSLSGGASFAADAGGASVAVGSLSLDVVLDAEGGCNKAEFADTLALPAAAQVRVSAAPGVTPAPGAYAVVTAGALEGSIAGWSLDASSLPSSRRARLAVSGGSVVVRVGVPGMMILMQ